MTEPFSDQLHQGRPRSLGRAAEVVRIVVDDRRRLQELFDCLFDPREDVRMRAADALEKVCRVHPEWFAAYVDRLLADVSGIDQPSVQWHLAQILGEVALSAAQRDAALRLLRSNLAQPRDWLVTTHSLETFARLARQDAGLTAELTSTLLTCDRSTSRAVVARARKIRRELDAEAPE
jgi:hypothetical protein